MQNFLSLGLAAKLGPALDEHGITIPTPIQAAAIPIAILGHDVIGLAQTGTGKTLAFGLPLLHQLSQSESRALILAPTRELATQITQSLRLFSGPMRISTTLLVGGAGMQPQINDLRRNPRIIVATPGRLIDLVERGVLKMKDVHHVVLDEADRMLDLGFAPAIERIMKLVSTQRQTMMFSATMPDSLTKLTSKYLKNPQRIEVAGLEEPVDLIEQSAYMVPQDGKGELLDQLVTSTKGQVLVFTRTRHGARKVARALRTRGHLAEEIHADRTQSQRERAMAGFRSGIHRILVATDIAARGIDVKDVALVAQYDMPDCDDHYVHRIGRTGRAGAKGRAVIMVTPEQTKDLVSLEKSVGFTIPTADDSPLTRQDARRGGRGNNSSARSGSGGEAFRPLSGADSGSVAVATGPRPPRNFSPKAFRPQNKSRRPR